MNSEIIWVGLFVAFSTRQSHFRSCLYACVLTVLWTVQCDGERSR